MEMTAPKQIDLKKKKAIKRGKKFWENVFVLIDLYFNA
jgi:hypothetical protein